MTAAPATPPPVPDALDDAIAAAPDVVGPNGQKFAPLSWALALAVRTGVVPGPYPEDFNGTGFAPTDPTPARPGTPDKIRALAERYKRRERLFHPRDAK